MIEKAFQNILGADELISGRSFTDTEHIQKDREILVYMAKQVRLGVDADLAALRAGKPMFVDEPDGRWHRYLIPRPMDLVQAKSIVMVGFFGQKRAEVSPDYSTEYSDRLIERIPTFPEILSYSTMSLPNGDFSNLVLLSNEEFKLIWMEGETHNRAVARSPSYYLSVRINNGALPQGVLQPDFLQITKVKYCDYRESPPWRAMRVLS
jgi:hypothetical protein